MVYLASFLAPWWRSSGLALGWGVIHHSLTFGHFDSCCLNETTWKFTTESSDMDIYISYDIYHRHHPVSLGIEIYSLCYIQLAEKKHVECLLQRLMGFNLGW